MEQIKGPAHPENRVPASAELLAYPDSQPILAEEEDAVVRHRPGTTVALKLHSDSEGLLWKKFVPERSVNDDFKIPFYEFRIRSAKRKASKYMAALFYQPKEI